MRFPVTVSHVPYTPLFRSTASSVNLRSGQNGRFTFSGTAGTSAGLEITHIITTPSGKAQTFTGLNPDGTTWKTASANGGYTFDLANEAQTCTYTLVAQTAS